MNALTPLPSTAMPLPALIAVAGDRASYRFVEFFTAQIRNRNTRRADSRAVGDFMVWLEKQDIGSITEVSSVHVATYVETLGRHLSAPSTKLSLAAIRKMFDWLATGGVLPFNPASAVRGPKHSVRTGKTLVLDAKEAR